MKFIKALILFQFICISSAFAAIDCDKAKNLKAEAVALLDQAQKYGLNSVDGIPLQQIKERVSAVCLIFMNNNRIYYGSRVGGAYDTNFGFGVARVLEDFTKALPDESRAAIVLHELLGAAGYFDRNFNVSMQIYLAEYLENNGFQLLQNTIEKRNLAKSSILVAGGGSGTSIGGGGDPTIILIKSIVMLKLGKLFSEGSDLYSKEEIEQMMDMALDCDFEPHKGFNAMIIKPLIKVFSRPVGRMTLASNKQPWFEVLYRVDWMSKAKLDEITEPVFKGMSANIKLSPNVQFCQQPDASWGVSYYEEELPLIYL